jgi:hypothetical protein
VNLPTRARSTDTPRTRSGLPRGRSISTDWNREGEQAATTLTLLRCERTNRPRSGHRWFTWGVFHNVRERRKLPVLIGGLVRMSSVWGCGVAPFRLLTWNVQNLFAAGSEDGPPDQAAFDAKLRSLAEVLDAQQPDVAALQELGPPEVLAQLQQRLGHQLPHQQLSEHPDGRGIRVGS